MKKGFTSIVKVCIQVMLLTICMVAYAQTGVVKGRVVDAEMNETLPGATVMVEGISGMGAVTDINGEVRIMNVPTGNQKIIVSFVGYAQQEIDIVIKPGENLLGNITMEQDFIMGEEVVITGQVNGQLIAINEQRNSDAIVNIVSADKIQELPDVNAAEAISRLPGVALERSGGEGQKVIIRGLQPKFAAITLNGVRLPSNSSSDRSVDISLIAPEMLSGIEVFKNPLPDMDAESTAGSVNLRLRKTPQGMRLLAKGLGGYNHLNNDPKDYKGLFQLSNRTENNKLGYMFQSSIERFNRSGDLIDYNWYRDGDTPDDPILGNRATYTNFLEIRRRFNSSLNLDYDLGNGHNIALFSLYSRQGRDRTNNSMNLNYGAGDLRYTASDLDNSLDLYNVSLSGEHPVGKVLMDWTLSRSVSYGKTPYNFGMEFGSVQSPQSVFTNVNTKDHPRDYADLAILGNDAMLRSGTYSESSTYEGSTTAILNFEMPISWTDKIGAKLKVGGKYFSIDRDRDWYSLTEEFYYATAALSDTAQKYYDPNLLISESGLILIDNFVTPNFNPEVIRERGESFKLRNSIDPGLMETWYNRMKPTLFENKNGISNQKYDLTENVYSFYAMLKLNVGNKLTVIPGMRFEYSDNQYNAIIEPDASSGRYGSLQVLRDTTTRVSYDNFFPHLHVKYQAKDWMELRFSYARTIARPDYTRVIPRVRINETFSTVGAGNSALRPTISDNYDFSLGLFKQGWGFFTAGAFYKDMTDIFVSQNLRIADAAEAVSFGLEPRLSGYDLGAQVNIENTQVYGLEFDLQTNLAALPAPWNGVVINVNFARLFSETEVFFRDVKSEVLPGRPPVIVETVTVYSQKIQMPSQAPSVFRASLGYDYKGFSFRVSTAYQGTRTAGYNQDPNFHNYNLGFWRVDAVVKQKFGENWSAFLNLNNLTNQQDISTRALRDKTYLNSIATFGPTGQIGLQYKLRRNK